MNVLVTPHALNGTVAAIASKSDVHRLLICASLADGPTHLALQRRSDDMDATARCLKAMGASITTDPSGLHINPIRTVPPHPLLDCGESGSTLRFLLPVATACCESVTFIGHGRLPQRPNDDLIAALTSGGAVFSATQLPLTKTGRLQAGAFALSGHVSSQYLSGMLMALPLLEKDSTITLTSPLASASYVNITCHALDRFGIVYTRDEHCWHIPGGQTYHSPSQLQADGDWSNAAFFLGSAAIAGAVTMTGLNTASSQGDKRILDILKGFGATVHHDADTVTVCAAGLQGQTIDVSDTPDLVPILAVVAANAQGTTHFINAGHLRFKESDRIQSVADMIRAMGGHAIEAKDRLTVIGHPLHGGTVDSCNDHRITMAAAIAAAHARDAVTITSADAANKSYPTFFDDFILLGGDAHVI